MTLSNPAAELLKPTGNATEAFRAALEGVGQVPGVLEIIFEFQRSFNPQLLDMAPEIKGTVEALLALCLERELHEALVEMPETKLWREAPETSGVEWIAEELLDTLMFYAMLSLAAGVSTQDLLMAFTKKVSVLEERYG